jgi:acyl-CoA synthetase (AMP-forming)/AMP-acid ligase II
MFISELLARAAWRWPDHLAAVDELEALTFAGLRDRVFRFANALHGLGLQPGDRVLDLQSNSVGYVVSDLGISSAGMVRVALNARLAVADLAYIARDCGARAIVFGRDHQALAGEIVAHVPTIEHVLGETESPLGRAFPVLIEQAASDPPAYRPRPGDTISLNYSSGTTGRPKGCMRTARNRYMSTQDVLLSLFEQRFGHDDVHLHAGPMMHASGLFVLPAIAVGATQRIMRKFDPAQVFELLADDEVTTSVLVPTMLDRVVAVAEARDERPAFERLNAVLYAGSPMAPDRVRAARALFKGKLLQFYGLVEAIPPVTVLSREDHQRDEKLGSTGQPVLGVKLEIVDDEGNRLPPGEVGEVAVSGDHVMAGYWGVGGGDGKTLRDGRLRTGDMGRLDEEGYLFLVDRRGDMIITGGYNVYPSEVEDALRAHAAVQDVVVVGVPHPDWGQAVTAFVVACEGSGLTEADLHDTCAARLASFKKPKEIVFVDELPTTAIGKVDRKALLAGHA